MKKVKNIFFKERIMTGTKLHYFSLTYLFSLFSWASFLAIIYSSVSLCSVPKGNAFWQDSSAWRNAIPLESGKEGIVKAQEFTEN